MTSLLLGSQRLTSDSSTRGTEIANPPRHLDRFTDAIGIDPSDLLAIAVELAQTAQLWPGMRKPRRPVWELMASSQGFEACVIGWPPGGAVELHDTAGAVAM